MDKDEVEGLFREIGPAVWRAVYGYSGGRRDVADEAVAEAFARAIHHAEAIRDPGAWIYRTAVRIAAREMRSEWSREGEHEAPASDFDRVETRHDLVAALRQLSPNQRVAAILVHVEDKTPEEAARLMGIAVPTLRVHLFRARRRLRSLLRGEGDA